MVQVSFAEEVAKAAMAQESATERQVECSGEALVADQVGESWAPGASAWAAEKAEVSECEELPLLPLMPTKTPKTEVTSHH
jgi:hypothetical protein